jgi:uncharacterized protein Veg
MAGEDEQPSVYEFKVVQNQLKKGGVQKTYNSWVVIHQSSSERSGEDMVRQPFILKSSGGRDEEETKIYKYSRLLREYDFG